MNVTEVVGYLREGRQIKVDTETEIVHIFRSIDKKHFIIEIFSRSMVYKQGQYGLLDDPTHLRHITSILQEGKATLDGYFSKGFYG